jgi:hypothetical protein
MKKQKDQIQTQTAISQSLFNSRAKPINLIKGDLVMINEITEEQFNFKLSNGSFYEISNNLTNTFEMKKSASDIQLVPINGYNNIENNYNNEALLTTNAGTSLGAKYKDNVIINFNGVSDFNPKRGKLIKTKT